MKSLQLIIPTLLLIIQINTHAQDCSSCDAYISGFPILTNVTVPVGETYCITGLASFAAGFSSLTVNGTLRLCGPSADFRSNHGFTIGPSGVVDVQDCPAFIAISGTVATEASHSIVYDCDLSASCGQLPVSIASWSGSGEQSVECNTVLPITLLGFQGSTSENTILLSWTTLDELNNDFFTLERSNNVTDFEELGRVQGSGTSFTQRDYRLTDTSPLNGTNYYRLKQTDYNGDFTYSSIIAVVYKNDNSIKIYPNPANAIITIQHPNTQDQEYNNFINPITLYSLQSNEQNISIISQDHNSTSLDISLVSSGYYILEYSLNNIFYRVPITVLH